MIVRSLAILSGPPSALSAALIICESHKPKFNFEKKLQSAKTGSKLANLINLKLVLPTKPTILNKMVLLKM